MYVCSTHSTYIHNIYEKIGFMLHVYTQSDREYCVNTIHYCNVSKKQRHDQEAAERARLCNKSN